MKILIENFVTLFRIGQIPFAPGTLGSIFAIVIWFIFIQYFSIFYYYALIFIIFLISFRIVDYYLNIEKKEDPSEVIIDEFIGQSLPLLFLLEFNIYEVLLAFSTFRIFDIFKIYPVNIAENIKGSIGVILDDLIAGVYSLIIVLVYRILINVSY
tara:strand:+ start:65 stop:529 length:465 start_codon:yes stop_codon:yes gene_type:complete